MDFTKKIKHELPKSFLKEEVRCGYKVCEQLKKVWAVELDLLNELIRLCKKHDIKMIVYCGTLLGAIRHHGFIPWDDDIDVAFLREDFEKLLQVAPKEFRYPYFFQTASTDTECFVGYARLRNSLTTGLIKGCETPKYNSGIYIDIFVLDAFIEDSKKLSKQIMDKSFVEKFINKTHYYLPSESRIKRMLNNILHHTVCKIVPYSWVLCIHSRIVRRFNGQTDRLSLMTHDMSFITKYWCNRSDFDNIYWVPFENIEVPIPTNYDTILKRTYGNYMEYPPVSQRGAWHSGVINFFPDIPYKEYFKTIKK